MKCLNCGNELANHAKFCTKCGTPLQQDSSGALEFTESYEFSDVNNEINDTEKEKQLFVWREQYAYIVIAAVIVIAAIVGFIVKSQRKAQVGNGDISVFENFSDEEAFDEYIQDKLVVEENLDKDEYADINPETICETEKEIIEGQEVSHEKINSEFQIYAQGICGEQLAMIKIRKKAYLVISLLVCIGIYLYCTANETGVDAEKTMAEENFIGEDNLLDNMNADSSLNLISDSGISETNESEQEDKVENMEWTYLIFVDVFGESYQTKINPNVSSIEYDLNKFVFDGSRLRYEDDNYYSRLGVDVSYHQGYINWEKVKDDGYDFAFIRLGYRGYGQLGNVNLDKRFYENITNAQNAGLDVGVYFFHRR